MRGWTISPEMGPAMKTSAICDFETPRERRYGDAAHSTGSAGRAFHAGDGWTKRTVGHLDGPEDLNAEEADGECGEARPSWTEDARDTEPLP